MGEYTFNVTSDKWDSEVLQYDGIVLVDFWAAWCGPCRIVGPVVDEIATEYKDNSKVKVVKVNTDDNADLASKYKIMGIPTLMFIKNGTIADTMVGAVPKSNIVDKLEALLRS